MTQYEFLSMQGYDGSVEEIAVEKWLKRPGDAIKKGEAFAEVNFDKASGEYPAECDCSMVAYVAKIDEPLVRGSVMFIMEADPANDDVKRLLRSHFIREATAVPQTPAREVPEPQEKTTASELPSEPTPKPRVRAQPKPAPVIKPREVPREQHEPPISVTPQAREAAWDLGVDLANVLARGRTVRLDDVLQVHGRRVNVPLPRDVSIVPTASAKRLAQRFGIDVMSAVATGLGGSVITEEDVARIVNPLAEPQKETAVMFPDGTVLLPTIRQKGAKAFDASHTIIPDAHSSIVIAMKWTFAARKDAKEKLGREVDILHFVAAAVVKLLKDPRWNYFNGYVCDDNTHWVPRETIGLGISVARSWKDMLVVASVPDAGTKTFAELMEAIGDTARRTRDKKIGIADLEGLTFTINNTGVPRDKAVDVGYMPRTNTGPFGDRQGVSIIPWTVEKHPTSCILSLGSIDRTSDYAFAIFSLGFDHRLVDGMNTGEDGKLGAIDFLVGLKILLESEEFLAEKLAESK